MIIEKTGTTDVSIDSEIWCCIYDKINNFMKLLIASLFMVLLFVSTACSQTSTPDYDKLTAEVYEMFQRNMQLFQNNDIDGLVNRFTPDGSLKMPGAPRISGHDALRKHYSGDAGAGGPQPDEVDFKFAFISVDIAEAGDMAVVMAEFDISSLDPGGSFNDSGVILMVLRRVDNEWKIFAENVSSGPVSLSEE